MKQKVLLAIFLLISFSCFGKKKYTIPKADFQKQFEAGIKENTIYCYKEDGSKVWFSFNKSTNLTIKLLNNEEKVLELHTVKYKNGIIEGRPFNVWLTSRKIYAINIDEVKSFHLERKFQESEQVFFDIDSSRNLAKLKNDSLSSRYLSRDELMINWVPKANVKKGTLLIRENACYNMVFKDGIRTENGVVQKITQDSIYISNTFNQEWAAGNKKEFKVLGYAIQDIMQLRVLKSGGYSYKELKAEDYDMIITKANKDNLSRPYWFAASYGTGEVGFYRAWLTERGFLGIMQKEGRIYWYEGE